MQNQALGLIGRALECVRIRDHHARTKFVHLAQCFGSVPCLGDDLNVRFVFQQSAQPLPQQDMVMHQQATNFVIA